MNIIWKSLLPLACGFLFGCASSGAGQGANSPTGGGEFVFGWTAPCRVPVVEDMERKGERARVAFVLEVQPAGDDLHVRRLQYRLLSSDGGDATTPEAREEFDRLEAIQPTMVVRNSGEIVDILGLDQLIDHILAQKADETDPATREKVRRALRSPGFRDMQRNRAAEYWEIWVGAWRDFGPRPGSPREVKTTSEMFGVEVPIILVGEHLGESAEYPGLAHLRITSTTDADGSSQAIEAIVGKMMKQMGHQLPADFEVRSFEKVNVIEVFTDPATLRPARARRVARWRIDGGEKTVQSREMQDYRFDWAHAEGCELPSR